MCYLKTFRQQCSIQLKIGNSQFSRICCHWPQLNGRLNFSLFWSSKLSTFSVKVIVISLDYTNIYSIFMWDILYYMLFLVIIIIHAMPCNVIYIWNINKSKLSHLLKCNWYIWKIETCLRYHFHQSNWWKILFVNNS